MPVILHGFFIGYLILHFLHLFITRYLVMDLGLPYPIASLVTFVGIGVVLGLMFHRHHSFL